MLDTLTSSSTALSILEAVDNEDYTTASSLSASLSTALSSISPIHIYICDAYIDSLSNNELASLEEKTEAKVLTLKK